MKGLYSSVQVKVASAADAIEYKWTRAMDEQLVKYVDHLTNKNSRRLMSMTFRDVLSIQAAGSSEIEPVPVNLLRTVPMEHIRARFAILKMLSTDYMRVLPMVDMTFRSSWSIAPLAKQLFKSLVFHQSKVYLWRSLQTRLFSEERPQFVILNRHEALKVRRDESSRLQHSLMYQLYQHIGRLCDPSSLRRRGQAWMVKFVGEGMQSMADTPHLPV